MNTSTAKVSSAKSKSKSEHSALLVDVLGQGDSILSSHRFESNDELVLIGQSPKAHVQLRGKGIAGLHVAIRAGQKPVIMDLGGPSSVRIDGAEVLEQILDHDSAVLEIGSQRVRVRRPKSSLPELRAQAWEPIANERDKSLTIRVRLYVKGIPQAATNAKDAFVIGEDFGVARPHKLVEVKSGKASMTIPQEWVQLSGRIQVGKSSITKLSDWGSGQALEENVIYRVFAGPYLVEILISNGQFIIGGEKLDLFPKELRKPFGLSAGLVMLTLGIWTLLIGRPNPQVEEPYTTYARIQNIPVEKIYEPEKTDMPSAGGGSGAEQKDTTAPQTGAPAQSSPSKLALALTGGLKNLVGNVVSSTKSSSNAVVADSGVSTAAAAASGAGQQMGKLAAVGQSNSNAIAGSSKLGKLALGGSGKGVGGGSGTGLGTGIGAGIGSGTGNGIGRGSFRLVEEESFVDGGLDKSVIAAVIQNNLSQIKYCYERQLVAEPDLFGKVVVLWTINGEGRVEGQNVKQTTLNSNPVEQCMLSKIGGWQFPKPKNGSKVTVTYPFLFKSTQ